MKQSRATGTNPVALLIFTKIIIDWNKKDKYNKNNKLYKKGIH